MDASQCVLEHPGLYVHIHLRRVNSSAIRHHLRTTRDLDLVCCCNARTRAIAPFQTAHKQPAAKPTARCGESRPHVCMQMTFFSRTGGPRHRRGPRQTIQSLHMPCSSLFICKENSIRHRNCCKLPLARCRTDVYCCKCMCGYASRLSPLLPCTSSCRRLLVASHCIT
jgi:hypothetical protein